MTGSDNRSLVRVDDRGNLRDTRVEVSVDGEQIVVFAFGTKLYAYANRCPHAGGPVCAGRVMPAVVAEWSPDAEVERHRFDPERPRLVCPWHGWEFELESGACVADPRRRLRRFPVRELEDGVYVEV